MYKVGRLSQAVYAAILVLATLTSVGLAGCRGNTSDIQLGADDSGTQITLKKGQTVAITLESNPTTGYSWQAVLQDDGVLVQVGEAEFEENRRGKDVVGAGGVETLRFEAEKSGQTTLELAYRRPWEGDVKPVETFSVQVTVE